MKIDYSSVLKTERIRPEHAADGTILAELEHDRSRILFSAAFRRLQQCACSNASSNASPSATSSTLHAAPRSKMSDALQAAQVGRAITQRIAAGLEPQQSVDANAASVTRSALVMLVETGCLLRHVGSPPFGRAGEAGIQGWFAEHGSEKIRAACKTHGGRAIEAADPRLLNALADFYEFGSDPQGLRVIAKLPSNTDPRGLNLTKTSIATTLAYLRMAGTESADAGERFTEKVGFFSTEAGLVKNVWSEFAYNAAEPQRFPLTYIVEAADEIVTTLADLEQVIAAGSQAAFSETCSEIKSAWLGSHPPATDPADELIRSALSAAIEGKHNNGENYGFSDLRIALIDTLSDSAARRYLEQHQAVFAGTLDALLSSISGAGMLLVAMKSVSHRLARRRGATQRQEVIGYMTVYNLLEHFGKLLACSTQRFQAALHEAEQDEQGKPIFLERKLLSLIPSEYLQIYSHVLAHIDHAHGRDAEFEEWNARAHLLVDFLAGLTEPVAVATLQTLRGNATTTR